MFSILVLDAIVILVLVYVASRHGLAASLPYFVFFAITIPDQSQFKLPGLFDLTTRRLAIVVLFFLFLGGKAVVRKGFPLKWLIVLAIVWTAASTVGSLSFATSAKQFVAQGIEFYLVYYIFITTITRIETVEKIALGLVLAVGLCCIFGVMEAYAHWTIMSLFPEELLDRYGPGTSLVYFSEDRGLRVQSTFPHPILFGDAIAMTIPIGFYLLSKCKNTLHRKLVWIALPLMFWNVYKTGSRGAWLATGIGMTLLFILLRKRVRKYILIFTAVGASVLVIRPGVWESLYNMYLATQDPTNPLGMSYDFRYALSHAVQNAVQKDFARALFGYGLGTFRELGLVVEFRDTQHATTYRWYTCDSSWILMLYETGYGGLLIVMTILFKPLVSIFRRYRRTALHERQLSATLFTSMLTFYFSMLSVSAYVWGQPGVMLWIVISIAVASGRVKRTSRAAGFAEWRANDAQGFLAEDRASAATLDVKSYGDKLLASI